MDNDILFSYSFSHCCFIDYHINAVYNRLMTVDSNFNLSPELAKSWSVTSDGLTWTFNQRKDIKFHDGTKFDANDVVYTYRRVLDPAVGSGGRGSLVSLGLHP